MYARASWDQVEFHFEHPTTKGKENIMKGCTYGATLEELLNRPMGILALHGRDGEDDGAKPGDEAGSKDGEKPDDDNEEDDKDDKGKPKGDKAETVETLGRKLANSEEARNRNADKRKEAETALAEANKTIAKLQKDGTPDDAVKTENDTLTKTNATLVTVNQGLMLQIALRDDKSHDWADPDAALKLADLSEVEFDEKTSKAIGLKAALDKLAKDKPFLLKPKVDDNADDKDEKPEKRRTGTPPAPRKPGNQSEAAAEAARLKAKYPALRRG